MQEDPTASAPQPEGGRHPSPAGRKRSVRPGLVLALLVTAVLVVFVVQNDSEVPVTWLVVTVNGPLWAVIIAAATAGAVLTQVLGWVVRLTRRRRQRRSS